ncbi:PAS domain-containing protein [Streptomyces seoulensis]|uniref:PAC domain-containing protein n=1 Tax=Streptomyces seoulensis TaxID=73044 RepID=A0A4P6TR79_STRSO|nr:hypothetical protein D0Z67_00850 [Streptomyces seoulensis]
MPPPVSADSPPAGHPEGVPSGRAEWGLLTDEADWSVELYRILGLDPSVPALSLDELPVLVHEEDRPRLTAMVTGCLVDARPIDGEFRVRRPDDSVRTVHMRGEPVLGTDGGAVSMRAVIRDVSELRSHRGSLSAVASALDLATQHTPGAPPVTVAAARSGWAVPLLFRDGTGRRLTAPDDPPPGANCPYGQAELTLRPGDLLLLPTERLSEPDVTRLLGLGPRLSTAGTARECLRMLAGELGAGQDGDAGVLVVRVSG